MNEAQLVWVSKDKHVTNMATEDNYDIGQQYYKEEIKKRVKTNIVWQSCERCHRHGLVSWTGLGSCQRIPGVFQLQSQFCQWQLPRALPADRQCRHRMTAFNHSIKTKVHEELYVHVAFRIQQCSSVHHKQTHCMNPKPRQSGQSSTTFIDSLCTTCCEFCYNLCILSTYCELLGLPCLNVNW